MGEAFARALARHFYQTQRCEPVNRDPSAIPRQRLLELGQYRLAVQVVLHVDEVDDDDSAQIAQAQLARDDVSRLEVGLEDRVVEVATADEPAGVHIHRGERLGLIDDQIAAGLQWYATGEGPLDLVLDAVEVEQRPITVVMLDVIGEV